MKGARFAFLVLLLPAVWMPLGATAMSERPRQSPAAEAPVPGDVQRVTLQVDGMT